MANRKFIICDRALKDWGKTGTLKAFLKIMENNQYHFEMPEEPGKGGDVYGSFEVQTTDGSTPKTVVVTTAGDPRSFLQKGIELAEETNADVFVCSCRPKGSDGATQKDVEKLAKDKGYTIIWFTNFHSEEEELMDMAHTTSADAVYNLLTQLIDIQK